MRKDDTAVNPPQTLFYINDPKLDTIALKIVWERDQRLWKNYVVKRYPVFDSIQIWDPRRIRKILKQIYLDNQLKLFQTQKNFRTWWGTVENRWYLFLEDIFELKIGGVCFIAYIGISPIFPRDIKNESFLVPLYGNRQDALRICAHETSHFFFYRKIKEVSFAVQPDEHRLWIISELFVLLLFSDHQAISILGQMPQGSYICKQPLIERCCEIYQKRSEGKISIGEVIERLLQVEVKTGELNTEFFK